jgi:spermidine synthase
MKEKNLRINQPSAFSLWVLFCFFLSGIAGLIYQILWLRMIDKVVGSAPFAVATVLSVFMGGLALGSWLAGKHIDKISSRRNLLSLYGKVELAIGIYGLLLPLFIFIAKPVYIQAYKYLFDHSLLYSLFTFFGCSVLLLLPTTLMGVTLPLLCRFYVEDLGHIGVRTGRLYGINTIGGAAGALLCGFFLIARFGVWGSLGIAVGINVLVGGLCILFARDNRLHVSAPVRLDKVAGIAKRSAKVKGPQNPEILTVDNKIVIYLALLIFCISGFCSMAYEVFWTRLLGLIIGPTTYSFSLVVSTFIIGLALGNIIFGWLADRTQGVFRLLVITQACAACLALLVSQFLGNSQFVFSKLIYTFQGDFGKMVIVQTLVLFFVLIGPTIFLGATFPLVNRIYARSLPDIGKSIGTAYAVNTIGAILGSFAAGFILIPLLGKENGLRSTAGLQIVVSLLVSTRLVFKTWERLRASVTVFAALILGILLLISFPSWNHNILSKGRYYRFEDLAPSFTRTSWFEAVWKGPSKIAQSANSREVVFYGDGVGGFTTVEKEVGPFGTADYSLLNSGKADASSRIDRLTQSLLAHIPLLFHPDPEKVMVIGLASGMTAGEALLYPVKQMDVLEINSQAVKACEFFTPWNNNCLTNPKSRIIVQDGRNHLELTQGKYDVIISEPSNPWMAGLANLFTLEFFETAKKRLNSSGIFVQWIHSYDMDWSTFAMVGRTFAEAFPDGLLMKMMATDFLLVGFSGKKDLDLALADKNLAFAGQSKNIAIKDPKVLFNLIVTEDLKGFFGSGPFHTDNWPRLEFAAPKNLGKYDVAIDEKIKQGGWLSKKTSDIVESNKNIDSSLDNLELLTANSPPPFKDVDLKKATPEQYQRYEGIVLDYCRREHVTNYDIFPNPKIRKQCAQIQVTRIQDHLAKKREDGHAYVSLAAHFKILGNTQEEMDALQKAISLNPSLSYAYMELGKVFAEQARFDEARAQLTEALRIDPEFAAAHNTLGNLFAAQGRTADAIEQYSKALKINPSYAEAYNNLGGAYVSQGRTADAIEQYNKALDIEPDYAFTHRNLASVLAGQGRLDEALTHINEALKISPENADFHNEAGLVLGQQKRFSESMQQFSEALRIDPNHFYANYNMGITLSRQGQPEEAVGYFLKAADIRHNNPEVQMMLGATLARLGRFKQALEHFSEALKIEPDSAELHDNLGVLLAQMGRLEEAIGHFKRALEIDNTYETARSHLQDLQKALQKGR